jgi:hypothetical protein
LRQWLGERFKGVIAEVGQFVERTDAALSEADLARSGDAAADEAGNAPARGHRR